MYYILIILNLILLAYVVFTFVKPQKALFFIKDSAKRKIMPYSLLVLVAYLVVFFILAGVIDNTDERKSEVVQKEERIKEEEAQKEADQAAKDRDSQIRTDVHALNQLIEQNRLSHDGPDSRVWREQQYLFAQRDSLNLVWVEDMLDNHFNIKKDSKEARDIDDCLIMAASSTWKDQNFASYYNHPRSYQNDSVANAGLSLQRIMDRNSKWAVRLNKRFNEMLK